jgi:hypothetical protein
MTSKPLLLTILLTTVLSAHTPTVRGDDKRVVVLAARIDERIAAAWGKDIQPAAQADDAEFCRRIHLDLTGRIPSIVELRDFLDDSRPDKRRLWVDRILQADADDASYHDAYSRHFANVWRGWLLAQPNQQALFQQSELEHWLRQRLKTNLGYDRLVRELLTQEPFVQRASSTDGSTVAFYLANNLQPESLAATTARVFLGIKIECAQCHKHPFASWTREQFWEYAAFFTDVTRSGKPQPAGTIKLGDTGKVVTARFLDGAMPQWKGKKPRSTLVEWMTAANNPYFARAVVNRLWAYFFGADLVEQLDVPADEEIASHRQLLDELAQEFIASNYDLKHLIGAMVASQTYQRTSAWKKGSGGKGSRSLFERMALRGLSPEQLFDSLAVATECQETAPVNPRDSLFSVPSPRAQFLAKFPSQDPQADHQTSILQALYLMNSEFVAKQTSIRWNPTLATLANQRTSTARKLESLYLAVVSRKPRPEESARFVKYVDAGDTKMALADVFWILLNSPEFILNH